MKKISIISLFLILLLILLTPVTAFAEDNISLIVDCNKIQMDVNPIIQNGRTLVPIRTLEKMNFTITWDDINKKVNVSKNNDFLELQINNTECIKSTNNKTEKILLDTAPIIYNDRTMVPVRFISETMGYIVDWDNKTKTVIIKTKNNSCDTDNINSLVNNFINEGLSNKKITIITKTGNTKNIQEIKNDGNRIDTFLYQKEKLTSSIECELNRGICTIDIDGKKEASVIDKKTSTDLNKTKETLSQTIINIENTLKKKISTISIHNETPIYIFEDDNISLTFYMNNKNEIEKLIQTKYTDDKKTDFIELIFEK